MCRTLTIYSSQDPGMYAMRFPYMYELKEHLKPYPGVRYAPEYDKGVWLAPMEAREFVQEACEKYDYEFLDKSNKWAPVPFIREPHPDCYPFQVDILKRLSTDPVLDGGLLVNLDLGLGKTVVSIQVFRCFFRAGTMLVVTPVRSVWEDEIAKWDDRENKQVHIIKTGAQAKDLMQDFTGKTWDHTVPHYFVTSYRLLKHFACRQENQYKMLVSDEVHMLSNFASGQTKAWEKIRKQNLRSLALGLTGTPIPDRVTQAAAQVSAIWPSRFAFKNKFARRYHYVSENPHNDRALIIGDLREDRLDELHHRLESISVRITKEEVAHLLPPLQVRRIEIQQRVESRKKALALAEEDYEEYLLKHSNKRIKEAAEWIENTGQSHVCAVTYHIDTAKRLCAELQDRGYKSSCVTGQMSQEKRKETIKKSLADHQHFLVCSMKSVGVGVDVLAGYSTALFVELSYRPVDVTQTIGRFYRLSSLMPVTVAFLVLKGTLDDLLIDVLMPKVDQIAQTMKQGTSEEQLLSALQETETEEDFFARMRAAVGED